MYTPQHGGNLDYLSKISGIPADRILDFSANLNPLGPPEWFRSAIESSLSSIVNYPDPLNSRLIAAAADRYGCKPNEIVFGNGSTELLHHLVSLIDRLAWIVPHPTYSDYFTALDLVGADYVPILNKETNGFDLDFVEIASAIEGDEGVIICNPNNPTGRIVNPAKLKSFIEQNSETFFIIDESFGDFVDGFDSFIPSRPANVVVLKSLTKIYAVPGLRVGCVFCDERIANDLRNMVPSWSVNTLAQVFGERALRDVDYVARTRNYVSRCRTELTAMLNSIPGLKTYPASANFLLSMITRSDLTAGKVADRMLKEHGIAVRVCTNIFGLDNRFLRFAVRTEDENIRMVEALEKVFAYKSGRHRSKPKPSIMFQGTSSNAGKSVLTAAMGRILLQDGYRVAPFKSQNMSLNSFVTRQGGEMGRAQVVQAQACKLDPDVRMNPILLKPNTDTGSQVIVMGKPVGNMDVKEYVRYKPEAFEAAKRAYDSLAGENDVMVIEGAGSPAEINLKHHDIVNMQMARYAGSPVLLVGDIDRGGVYASFVGTMELLTEWERAITAGFVVNRFRGDAGLLKSAHDYVLAHTGRPVLGVVPYFHDLGLPEEDSVSFKDGLWDEVLSDKDGVRIAIIDLPHISNFTDFDALRIEPDVQLQIIKSAMDLNSPDAIIIPGSKNTIGDLEFLKGNGLADKLQELCDTVPIIGICGGFQMLGSGIADPYALETSGKTVPGLGLLEVVTLLEKEKTLTRIEAKHIKSGQRVFGYEIHHGISDVTDFEPAIMSDKGKLDGAVSPSGMVWGTYIHGIFDSDDFRRWFINELRAKKNLAPLPKSATYDLEGALDRLAESVRNSIDLKDIYKLMGI